MTLRGFTVGVVVLALLIAGCSSGERRASPAPTTAAARAISAPPPSAALTAEQLRAHLGAGVPSDWDPIDGGDARVWVPNTWSFGSQWTCDFGGTSFVAYSAVMTPLETTYGYVPDLPECDPMRQQQVSTQAFAFLPLSPSHAARPTLTVHGYGLFLTHQPTRTRPWTAYDVPRLDVQIATHGTLGRRILDTLGPSSRYVALSAAYENVPKLAHVVTTSGMSLAIPPSWPVVTPKPFDWSSYVKKPHQLAIVTPVRPVAPVRAAPGPQCCGPGMSEVTPTPAERGLVPADGATLYLRASDDSNNQWYDAQIPNLGTTRGRPVAILHHGATTITIWAEPYAEDTIDLFVRRDQTSITHALVLELGRDGRTAAGIIASLRTNA